MADRFCASRLMQLKRQPPHGSESNAQDGVRSPKTLNLRLGDEAELCDLRSAKRQSQNNEVADKQ